MNQDFQYFDVFDGFNRQHPVTAPSSQPAAFSMPSSNSSGSQQPQEPGFRSSQTPGFGTSAAAFAENRVLMSRFMSMSATQDQILQQLFVLQGQLQQQKMNQPTVVVVQSGGSGQVRADDVMVPSRCPEHHRTVPSLVRDAEATIRSLRRTIAVDVTERETTNTTTQKQTVVGPTESQAQRIGMVNSQQRPAVSLMRSDSTLIQQNPLSPAGITATRPGTEPDCQQGQTKRKSQGSGRKRGRKSIFTDDQVAILTKELDTAGNRLPSIERKQQLADSFGVPLKKVEGWFYTRRSARQKQLNGLKTKTKTNYRRRLSAQEFSISVKREMVEAPVETNPADNIWQNLAP